MAGRSGAGWLARAAAYGGLGHRAFPCTGLTARGGLVPAAGGAHSRNPAGNGSSGSRRYCAVPVTQARPVIVGTIAGSAPAVVTGAAPDSRTGAGTVVSSTTRPVNRLPMNDSL